MCVCVCVCATIDARIQTKLYVFVDTWIEVTTFMCVCIYERVRVYARQLTLRLCRCLYMCVHMGLEICLRGNRY